MASRGTYLRMSFTAINGGFEFVSLLRKPTTLFAAPLKTYCLILLVALLPCSQLFAQYYITGLTTDSANNPLPFVKMKLKSSGVIYQSGSSGGFGIPSAYKADSVLCYLQGFDTVRAKLVTPGQNTLVMYRSKNFRLEPVETNRLSSLTRNMQKDVAFTAFSQGESYSSMLENGFVKTSTYPSTGFSPNASNAAYSNIRRFINNKSEVPIDAVRIEEMLNYFSLSCAKPPMPGTMFNVETALSDCPWNAGHMLLYINAQAKALDMAKVPPANLVFLIDNSGSMDMPNRLPLLKAGFKMLVNNLRDTDRVSIVTYGGNAMIALPPTKGSEKDKIAKAIQEIVPGGVTPGSNGIQLAYELAITNRVKDGNNRVILATDGDFNVGITEEEELKSLIERYKSSGVYLTCLGVGMGNYKDSKIEVLSRHGNGNFAYLDKEQEAEKVLVKELTQNLYAVASDVTFDVDLNPDLIKKYRLIGYDNRKDALRDSSSKLLGVEIGSSYSMVSIFEIEPADTGLAWKMKSVSKMAGMVSVKCINSANGQQANINPYPIPFNYQSFASLNPKLRFATAITMFGSALRKSTLAPEITFDLINPIASSSIDPADPLQVEFVQLVDDANIIYNPEKKKKWGRKD